MRGQVLLAVSALSMALMAQPAAAGGYPSYNDAYQAQSQQCQYERHGNTAGGAILGGILGAVVGSHVAANHHRSDGALVGAGAGALLGGSIGNNSRTSACDNRVQGSYDPYYGQPQQGYAPPPQQYDRYADRGYDDRRLEGGPYDSGYRDDSYRRRDCRWGEIVVRDRDGYPERQNAWMCRGRDGEWRPMPRY